MLDRSIFNIPFSLPSLTHSISLATRPPSYKYAQDSRYMPDYGGILEIPKSITKNYALGTGIPFDPYPYYIRVQGPHEEGTLRKPKPTGCLSFASYLDDDNLFSTIRAMGSVLYFDAITKFPDHDVPRILSYDTYAHVPYRYDIESIKFRDQRKNLLLVNFPNGVKLLKLNQSFELPDEDGVQLPDQSAIDFVGSFAEESRYKISDSCLGYYRSTLATLSSDSDSMKLRLFDLKNSKKLITRVVYPLLDDRVAEDALTNQTDVRPRRSQRLFAPLKREREAPFEIESDPYHLFNMILTTSRRVMLIDPRENEHSKSYIDKNKVKSVIPTELFRKINFSQNEHQIYLLSNQHVRALDRRWLNTPMNTVAHQLDASNLKELDMEVLTVSRLSEITCTSLGGHLSFITFEPGPESDRGINPKSLHYPFHEDSPRDLSGRQSDELYGLSASVKSVLKSGYLAFSVFQLSEEGDVCIRGYKEAQDKSQSRAYHKADVPSGFDQETSKPSANHKRRIISEMGYREDSDSDTEVEPDSLYGQVLGSSHIESVGLSLKSKRASSRLQNMEKKLLR